MTFVSKFNDAEIGAILDEFEAGESPEVLCQRHGMTLRTFYRWKSRLQRNRPALEARLKALEAENQRLKQLLETTSGVSAAASAPAARVDPVIQGLGN